MEMKNDKILNEKQLEVYGSLVVAYKKYSDNISILEKNKQKEQNLSWIWILLGFFIWLISNYSINLLLPNIFYASELIGWVYIILLIYGLPFLLFSLYELAVKHGIIDFWENIISFGKLRQTKSANQEILKKIDETKNEKEHVKKQIQDFEQVIKTYYEKYLSDYFYDNLYNKRSDGVGYGKSLEQLSLIIEEAEDVNDMMIIEKCSLEKYKNYLVEKQIKVAFQKQAVEINKIKPHNSITPLGKKINTVIQNSVKQDKPSPPEVLYRTARQINWDKINKQRRLTGLKGEEIAMILERDYLIQSGSLDLAEKIKHVSKELGDGLGYDILSFFPDGREKYIEVKSSTQANGISFHISKNELEFLQQNLKNAFIYRIFSVNNSDINPSLKIDTAEEVISNSEIIPTEYLVKL